MSKRLARYLTDCTVPRRLLAHGFYGSHAPGPPRIPDIRRYLERVNNSKFYRAEMAQQQALMLAAQRIHFVTKVGKDAAVNEMRGCMRKEVICECRALSDLLDEFGLIERVGMKENTIEVAHVIQYVLTQSVHDSDILFWILLPPGLESPHHSIIALDDGVRSNSTSLNH